MYYTHMYSFCCFQSFAGFDSAAMNIFVYISWSTCGRIPTHLRAGLLSVMEINEDPREQTKVIYSELTTADASWAPSPAFGRSSKADRVEKERLQVCPDGSLRAREGRGGLTRSS